MFVAFASSAATPTAPVFLTRSEPARSTMCSFVRRGPFDASSSSCVTSPGAASATATAFSRSMKSEKTACERLELQFIWVAQTARLASANATSCSACSSDATGWRTSPSITTGPHGSAPSSRSRSALPPPTLSRSSSFSW